MPSDNLSLGFLTHSLFSCPYMRGTPFAPSPACARVLSLSLDCVARSLSLATRALLSRPLSLARLCRDALSRSLLSGTSACPTRASPLTSPILAPSLFRTSTSSIITLRGNCPIFKCRLQPLSGQDPPGVGEGSTKTLAGNCPLAPWWIRPWCSVPYNTRLAHIHTHTHERERQRQRKRETL